MQLIQAQTVDEIINKYVDARGGLEKLKAIKSLYMEGSRQMMGNEVPVKVIIVQDKLFRNDFEFGGTSGYSIITPTAGWNFIPMRSTKAESIPEERLKTMQAQLDIAGSLVDYAVKGNKVELQGKEPVDGNDCYKIKLTQSSGKENFYYIDAKTYLLNQAKTMVQGQGGKNQEMITNFTDYKNVDGVMFPQTIANPGAGMMAGSTTFDKIEMNKPVDEKLYKPSN
jgi:hypothetical protein